MHISLESEPLFTTILLFKVAILYRVQRLFGQRDHLWALGCDRLRYRHRRCHQVFPRHHRLNCTQSPGLPGVNELSSEIHVPHFLHREQSLKVRTSAHRTTVHLRHTKRCALGGH